MNKEEQEYERALVEAVNGGARYELACLKLISLPYHIKDRVLSDDDLYILIGSSISAKENVYKAITDAVIKGIDKCIKEGIAIPTIQDDLNRKAKQLAGRVDGRFA